ncbi:MAG: dihydroorotase [Candidatus Thermoplasmatota archaeon]|nr:dihydroorotase [Candidatus Thermoplasmatota archaeon]
MFELVLEGRILRKGHPVDAFICVNGGLIEEIRRIRPGNGEIGELHRMGRRILLPGVIDTHVHMRDPGLTMKEDMYSGSVSAAFGGVTAFIDMPNNKPPTMDSRTLREKERIASASSVIDHGFNLCITAGSDREEIERTIRAGGGSPKPPALKVFMGETTGSLIFGPYDDLADWAPVLERNELPLCIHAEDGDMFQDKRADNGDILANHNGSRPPVAEASSIEKVLSSLSDTRKMVHILHVSSAMGMDAARGQDCTLEATPHHLFLDIKKAEKMLEDPAFAKVNPPIRSTSDRAALWDGIQDGRIFTIGSDHAPHTLEEKMRGAASPSGMPGTETMLPLLLHQVSKRRIGLGRVIDLLSRNPADRFSLSGRGSIDKGNKADIIAVDLSNSRMIKAEELHSKCGWSAFEGMMGIFPDKVYSRGELIVEGESLCCKKGRGLPIFD